MSPDHAVPTDRHPRLDHRSKPDEGPVPDRHRRGPQLLVDDRNLEILADEIIELTSAPSARAYPNILCRVVARVEVYGELREMVFLTNNFTWSAQSVADLFRCRWSIECFFKEPKQTLQLADFLGTNANAAPWQVWTALLAYLLLRFAALVSQSEHSFTRLFALIRTALWQKLHWRSFLEVYGTATGGGRFLGTPDQAYLPGLG